MIADRRPQTADCTSRSPQVRVRERQTRERGRPDRRADADTASNSSFCYVTRLRQRGDSPAPETRYRTAVIIMLLPCPDDDSIRVQQSQIPKRVACAPYLLCSVPLLPFALALALILAARSPPPILKGRGRSRGLVHRCKLLCCALRCGARIAPQLSTNFTTPIALLPPSRNYILCCIVSIFARLTPPPPPPPPPPLPPFRDPGRLPCDSQTRSLALVPAGQ
ncbi:uncharacterized protein K444DRAFT_278985 [Hyaloscypha bicolor E]|uniref:Uncharacterized protein n=1 Tax=Hyaloscypha bicolor E TaxID=1095630 RepID=A0A2J6SGX4_9HELO|nr:uncharacterized protein K444DRAFT_278985 [Hyaloscypha bicolor E]PMD50023.1 hypothetical protein K444DRAFT_278985 [Hyaloscypha bicolor E]